MHAGGAELSCTSPVPQLSCMADARPRSAIPLGLHRAMRVVLLTNSADALAAATASNAKASAPELAANGVVAGPSTFDAVIEDSAVIFAYQFINEHFPKVP